MLLEPVATAAVSVATVNSYDLTVIVSSGAIQKGLVVEGTGIPVGTLVAQCLQHEEAFTLNTQVSLSEDTTVLTFKLPSKYNCHRSHITDNYYNSDHLC